MGLKEFSNEFKKYLNEIDLTLSDEKIEKFYKYMNLIVEWNEKINLTAITVQKEMIIKHFIDSLSIAKNIPSGSKVIDVGTGAGFPGIPLKIYDESINITLLDSLNKRINFLNEVASQLNFNRGIDIIHARAEEMAQNPKYRAAYDYAVSRAVAPLNILLEYLVPYTKLNGHVIAMKGSNADEEIELSKNAIKELGSKVVEKNKFILPEDAGERYIIIVEKLENTKNKYPRKAGIPKKEPL